MKNTKLFVVSIVIFELYWVLPQAAFAQGAGYALDFDGVDESVSVPDDASLDLTTAATVEAWIKTNSTTKTQNVVSKWRENGNKCSYRLGLTSTNKAIFHVNSSGSPADSVSITGNTAVGTGWCHIVGVYNGTHLKIYLNGVEDQNEVSYTLDIASKAAPLRIGCKGVVTPREFFNGKIDEVRIWNVARTETEIRDNMFKKLAGTESGLVG